MTPLISEDALWNSVHRVLQAMKDDIVGSDATLTVEVMREDNDAFLLRAHLAVRRTSGGNEVAVTVDAQRRNGMLTLAADICSDEGKVLFAGPQLSLPIDESSTVAVETVVENWLQDLARFLEGCRRRSCVSLRP
jgi:hypothetical protein